MVGGLKYNEVRVQLASVYVCLQLYSTTGQAGHTIDHPQLMRKLVNNLLHVIENTDHSALISSLVGLY